MYYKIKESPVELLFSNQEFKDWCWLFETMLACPGFHEHRIYVKMKSEEMCLGVNNLASKLPCFTLTNRNGDQPVMSSDLFHTYQSANMLLLYPDRGMRRAEQIPVQRCCWQAVKYCTGLSLNGGERCSFTTWNGCPIVAYRRSHCFMLDQMVPTRLYGFCSKADFYICSDNDSQLSTVEVLSRIVMWMTVLDGWWNVMVSTCVQ